MIRRIAAGMAVSMAVAGGGWLAKALNGSAAVTATGVGTAVSAGSSWPGMLSLGTFFVSSSALSKVLRTPDTGAKGSRRDAVQVLANGGVAATASLAMAVSGRSNALVPVAGSLAAATADTWATEIGSSSGATPRLLVSRRTVQPGESGGVTVPGTLASAGGACLIAMVAGLSGSAHMKAVNPVKISASIFVAGISGSLVDSLAGELIQERRYCKHCCQATEATVHRCGEPAILVGGVSGVTNDVVNLLCTSTGALVALLLWRVA